MAKRYSGKHGKSGSTKPVDKTVPGWVIHDANEVQRLVAKLSKDGQTASEIGIAMRDLYGVPSVKAITGKTITKILEENKQLPVLPEDLMAVIRRNILLKKHLEANRQDMVAKRGLLLADSRIRRLVKYYKEIGRIEKDWKYEPEKIRLLIE